MLYQIFTINFNDLDECTVGTFVEDAKSGGLTGWEVGAKISVIEVHERVGLQIQQVIQKANGLLFNYCKGYGV